MSGTVVTALQSTRTGERSGLFDPGSPGWTRPEPETFDHAYWTRHCEGFRVDSGGGRIGFVDDVVTARGRVMLRVRLGRLGRHVAEIPADEIAFIVPRAQRVWLRTQQAW
jgi:hypothetical protein